jgi:S-adenosylmethionine hydrolase
MELINLTPHAVTIVDEDGNVLLAIASSGVARAKQADHKVGELMVGGVAVAVFETVFGDTDGLPEPAEGVAYVVSIITLNAARAQGRSTDDLFITNGLVRDAAGAILGCRALARA